MAIATTQDHDVVVDALTTETTQVVAQPDGTFQLTVDTDPVRVQRDDGWVPVDTSISLDADSGMLEPEATTVPVRFSAGGSDQLAQVQLEDGSWLAETWPLGDLPSPVIDGSSATYLDVLPDVDLRLTASATGMSEVLIINTASAAANPDLQSLELRVDGANVATHADGSTTADPSAEASKEDADLRSSAPQTWDSSSDTASADGPGVEAIAEPVAVESTDDSITLDIGSVVDDASLTYPVYVDPDWTGGTIHAWFVDQTYPNQVYLDGGGWAEGVQNVGYVQASWSGDGLSQLVRAFWQMNTSAVANKTIIAAHFNATEVYASSCNPRSIELWRVTGATPGGTWNNPGPLVWAQGLDSTTVAYGYNSSCPANTVGFNVKAGVAVVAASGGSNITFGMKAEVETDTYSWKKFSVGAQLIITYNTPPNAVASQVMTSPPRSCAATAAAPVIVNGTQPITLQANASDADGGNLSTRFYVENTSTPSANVLPSASYPAGYATTASQAQGNQSVTLAAGLLPPGHYQWSAKSFDGLALSANYFSCYFDVKNTLTALPGIANIAAGPYTVGQPTTLQFTSAPVDKVAVFVYWWAYTGDTSPTPPIPVTAGSTLPACNTGSGPVRYVCPTASGNSLAVTVAPVASPSTLWVAAYDAAGNVSQVGSSTATPVSYLALADTTNVEFGPGHGWPTSDATSPLGATLDDVNPSNPLPLTFGPGVPADAVASFDPGYPGQPIIELPGYLPISEFSYSGKHAEIVGTTASAGYSFMNAVGWIFPQLISSQTQPPNTNALYDCGTASDDYLSLTACGSTPTPIGYTWATSAAAPSGSGAVLLHDCYQVATDHFVSTSATCDGFTVAGSLGYILTQAPTHTTGPAVNTTQSFTVSAWLYPKQNNAATPRSHPAITQAGAVNSAFVLGATVNNHWQFCVTNQVGVATTTCADGGARAPSAWQYVTGVWDAENQQVKIFVGNALAPTAVVWRPLPAGEVSAGGALNIGSSIANGALADTWQGRIAYPTIFPGVANEVQRGNLWGQYYPN